MRFAESVGSLGQDIRYALRMLGRAPGFTAVAALTLALGIGANTAIFSLINGVLLHRLPVADASQLVVLQWSAHKSPKYHWYSNYGDTKSHAQGSSPMGTSFSMPFMREVEKSGAFSGLAAFAGGGAVTITGNGPAAAVTSQTVNGDFFHTLGVRAAAGRLIETNDDTPAASPVAVLSYAYWQRAFGGQNVVGKTVNLNSVPCTIVGVTDAKFVSLSPGNVKDVWYPMSLVQRINGKRSPKPDDITAWWVLMVGRLKPATTATQAQAELDVLFQNHVEHAAKPLVTAADQPRLELLPAQTTLTGATTRYVDPLRVLMIAVGIVLLIACANVAGLLLSRVAARRREIAIRFALGARRGRVLRQLLTESVLIAVMGGALGVVMALWAAQAILTMIGHTQSQPLGFTADVDLRVLAFTAGVSMLAGVLFGLAPALRSLRVDLTPALKNGAAAATEGKTGSLPRWMTLGNALVLAQAALAIVVLMGAGLLVHSLANLRSIDPGFDTRNTLTFDLDPTQLGYQAGRVDNFYRDLQQRLSALPGVLTVSYSQSALLSGNWSSTSFKHRLPGAAAKTDVNADYMPIGPRFFETMKIPLVSGRTFDTQDFERAAKNRAILLAARDTKPGEKPPAPTVPLSALINQTFARKYFDNTNPIGRTFAENDGSDPENPNPDPGYVVVGVVGDAKYSDLKRDIEPTIYTPITGDFATFELRTAGDPKTLVAAIRKVVGELEPNVPLQSVMTESEHIDLLLQQERVIAKLSSLFGGLALLLACVGLYGLLSYQVARRTREIGIRMALGARPLDVVRQVVRQGFALAAIGCVLGLAGAFGVGRVLSKMLYGVKASDPATLVSITVLLLAVALFAAFVPARRATQVDPTIVLRSE